MNDLGHEGCGWCEAGREEARSRNLKNFLSWVLAGLVLLCVVVAFAGYSEGQAVDIKPPHPNSVFIPLARNAVFNQSGAGASDCTVSVCGLNNNFVFPVLYQQETLTLSLFNGSAVNQSPTINLSVTNDPSVTSFNGNTGRWTASISGGFGLTTPGTSKNITIQVSGASAIAITIGAGTTTGTGGGDLVVSQNQTYTASASSGVAVAFGGGNTPLSVVDLAIGPGFVLSAGTFGIPTMTAATTGATYSSAEIPVQNGPTAGAPEQIQNYVFNGNGSNGLIPMVSQSSTNATAAGNATGTVLSGMPVVTGPAGWTVPIQSSAANCSASVAASATTRHCAIGVTMCVVATIAQLQLFVNLRDGATGAGTVKWNGVLANTAGLGSCISQDFSGGPVCGTINTAMTLELSAATGAGNGCASTLRGYDVLN